MSMYLAGICPGAGQSPGCWVMLEKYYKNVRHFYHPVAGGFEDPAIRDMATGLYHDPAFMGNKKIFSQMGRPAKTVTAHPLLVVLSRPDAPEFAGMLREKKVRFVSVSLADGTPAAGPPPIQPHDLHQAPASEIWGVFCRVHAQNRLRLDPEFSLSPLLLDMLKQPPETYFRPEDLFKAPWGAACATAVWFRETVRYKSAVATSGNRRLTWI